VARLKQQRACTELVAKSRRFSTPSCQLEAVLRLPPKDSERTSANPRASSGCLSSAQARCAPHPRRIWTGPLKGYYHRFDTVPICPPRIGANGTEVQPEFAISPARNAETEARGDADAARTLDDRRSKAGGNPKRFPSVLILLAVPQLLYHSHDQLACRNQCLRLPRIETSETPRCRFTLPTGVSVRTDRRRWPTRPFVGAGCNAY